MEKFYSPVRGPIPHMRSLRDEQNGSKACNDADPRPTLRNRVHHIYLAAPLDAQECGPRCKLGYYRVFNLILWVLYTRMQWKCSIPPDYVVKCVIAQRKPSEGIVN